MKKLIILFTIIFLPFILASVVLAQDSTSSSEIRQKVEAKVAEVLSNPKAYLGSVTDISDTTIQIKPTNGDIKQLAVDPTLTTSVNEAGATVKNIKLTDIAIGDFVIAMGYKNSNGVLDTRRILVITPLSAPTRKSYEGTIISVTKSQYLLKETKTGNQVQFSIDKKASLLKQADGEINPAKSSDLATDTKVIISGDVSQDLLTARKILILQ